MNFNKLLLVAILVFGSLSSPVVLAQKVNTFAGTGGDVFGGDGGLAIQTGIGAPADVVVDQSGNAYILQYFGYRVTKVKPDGKIYNYAGTGIPGYSGDGGPASEAQISYATHIAVDRAGNLYIADTVNHRIRKVDTNGKITTIAGNGAGVFAGEGVAAISSTIAYPIGIAADTSGNVFFMEGNPLSPRPFGGSRLRKIDSAGIMTTVAGMSGGSGFFGDGYPAIYAIFNGAQGITVDSSGNIYIADLNNARIRKIATDGIIDTIAGTGFGMGSGASEIPARGAALDSPNDVAIDDSGNVYISELFHVRKITPDGLVHLFAGVGSYLRGYAGDGGPAAIAIFSDIAGVASDNSGNVYIADLGNRRVRVVIPYAFTTCAAEGFLGAQLTLCRKICEVPHVDIVSSGLIGIYLSKFKTAPPCARPDGPE